MPEGGSETGDPCRGVAGNTEAAGASAANGAATAGGEGDSPGSVLLGTCGCMGEPAGRGGAYEGRGEMAPGEGGAAGRSSALGFSPSFITRAR